MYDSVNLLYVKFLLVIMLHIKTKYSLPMNAEFILVLKKKK